MVWKGAAGLVAVKRGWSWPAFFFGFIWAAAKSLWLVFLLMLLAEVIAAIIMNQMNPETASGFNILFAIVYSVFCGSEGNSWRSKDLKKKGYVVAGVVTAIDQEDAIAQIAQTTDMAPTKVIKNPHSVRNTVIIVLVAALVVMSAIALVDISAFKQTNSAFSSFDENNEDVKIAESLAGNANIIPDPSLSGLDSDYVSSRCLKLGAVVAELKVASQNGTVDLSDQDAVISLMAKLMAQEGLNRPTDYFMGASVVTHSNSVALFGDDPQTVQTGFALGCMYMGGYVNNYKLLHSLEKVHR